MHIIENSFTFHYNSYKYMDTIYFCPNIRENTNYKKYKNLIPEPEKRINFFTKK